MVLVWYNSDNTVWPGLHCVYHCWCPIVDLGCWCVNTNWHLCFIRTNDTICSISWSKTRSEYRHHSIFQTHSVNKSSWAVKVRLTSSRIHITGPVLDLSGWRSYSAISKMLTRTGSTSKASRESERFSRLSCSSSYGFTSQAAFSSWYQLWTPLILISKAGRSQAVSTRILCLGQFSTRSRFFDL